MKGCNTCIHKEIPMRFLPCRTCIEHCLWDMPTEYKKLFIEELEKIKEEIQGLIDFEDSCSGNTTLGYQCLGVVEDRISELKGENNDHT